MHCISRLYTCTSLLLVGLVLAHLCLLTRSDVPLLSDVTVSEKATNSIQQSEADDTVEAIVDGDLVETWHVGRRHGDQRLDSDHGHQKP